MELHPKLLRSIYRQAKISFRIIKVKSERGNKVKYTILLESSEKNYSACVPDLPGCVAAATTKEETIALMKESIFQHIRLMKESGEEIPVRNTECAVLDIHPI